MHIKTWLMFEEMVDPVNMPDIVLFTQSLLQLEDVNIRIRKVELGVEKREFKILNSLG